MSLTPEGRRQAAERAGFTGSQIESVSKTTIRHMSDPVTEVLEREFPDAEPTPTIEEVDEQEARRQRLRDELSLESIDQSLLEPPAEPPGRLPEVETEREPVPGAPIRNPTAAGAAIDPPIPRKPVRIEDATPAELIDGLKEMFSADEEETNLLFQDGARGPSKMARIIQRMVETLMIDSGLDRLRAVRERGAAPVGRRAEARPGDARAAQLVRGGQARERGSADEHSRGDRRMVWRGGAE